jgi:hypothetical protein
MDKNSKNKKDLNRLHRIRNQIRVGEVPTKNDLKFYYKNK